MKTLELFSELNLPKPLARSLDRMGFITPTPVQAATIPPALEGRDVLGTAQTGTGKTAAFGIPLLTALYPHPGKQALILAPTRELAAQISKVLSNMSTGMELRGTLLVGGESFSRQASEVKRGVDYMIATPGRLNDHLEQRTVNLSRVPILLHDEVDRMMDMGFAPQISRILKYVPQERQTLVFSATLPDSVNRLVHSLLKHPLRVDVGSTGSPVADVKEEIIQTPQEAKTSLLMKEIQERKGRILVFARTKARTERLARALHQKGFDVVSMHGGRSNGQRKEALRKYHMGSHRIMVATDLAGRGIDVANIQHVINYDMPGSREDYIHRIGRTARLGKTGTAVTFVSPLDLEADYIVSGKKKPSRTIYSSRRRRNRL